MDPPAADREPAPAYTEQHTAQPLSCSNLSVIRQIQGHLMPGLHRATPFAEAQLDISRASRSLRVFDGRATSRAADVDANVGVQFT